MNPHNTQFIRFKKHARQQAGGNPIKESDDKVKKNLELFHKLIEVSRGPNPDFNKISQYYDKNVLVVTPGGKPVTGYDQHEIGMRQMFQLAPDVRIISVDVEFGSGDWIAVATTMVGTSINGEITVSGQPPMKLTGKPFNMKSALLIRYENDKIVEFRSYWNDLEFAKQLGVRECPITG